jgi:small conductance mechanosensitive channel
MDLKKGNDFLYSEKSYAGIIIAVTICVVVLAIFTFTYNNIPTVIPKQLIIQAALTALVGIIGIEIISIVIFYYMSQGINRAEARTLAELFRIIAYIILAMIILIVGGASQFEYQLLIGAGFLGIVLGLAAQSTLSNFISGIYLLASKAMEPDDNVIIHTWQYTMQSQSYPHDKFVPGFAGRIESIGVLYTKLINNEGVPVYVPNSIVAQALVINYHRAKEHAVRLQFDVDLTVPYDGLEKVIMQTMKENKVSREKYEIDIEYLHTNLYVITIHLKLNIDDARPLKSILFNNIIKYLGQFKKAKAR